MSLNEKGGNENVSPSDDESKDLEHLMKWIIKFPYFDETFDDEPIKNDAMLFLQNDKYTRSLLHVVLEVCRNCNERYLYFGDSSSFTETVPKLEKLELTSGIEIWEEIQKVLQIIVPNSLASNEKVKILSLLLCIAVSDECSMRETYIGYIQSIQDIECQHTLKKIIEKEMDGISIANDFYRNEIAKVDLQLQENHPPLSSVTVTTSSLASEMQCFISTDISSSTSEDNSSEARLRSILGAPRPHPRIDLDLFHHPDFLKKKMKELQQMNNKLTIQLQESKEKEEHLTHYMEDNAAKQMLRNIQKERELIDKEEEIKSKNQKEMNELKQLLKVKKKNDMELREAYKKIELLEMRNKQLSTKKEKYESAEEQIRKYKKKLSNFEDMNETRKREEKIHIETVNRSLELENEVKQLKPLRQQVKKYMTRAIEAEKKIVDFEEEIHNLKDSRDELNGQIKFQTEQVSFLEAEIKQLREGSEYQEDEDDTKDEYSSRTFLNQNEVIAKEMDRLRKKNIRLKAINAHCSEIRYKKLEKELDQKEEENQNLLERMSKLKTELEIALQQLSKSKIQEKRLTSDFKSMKKEGAKMLKKYLQRKKKISPTKEQMRRLRLQCIDQVQKKAKDDMKKIEKIMRKLINDELAMAADKHRQKLKDIRAFFMSREESIMLEFQEFKKTFLTKKRSIEMTKSRMESYKEKLSYFMKRQREFELLHGDLIGAESKTGDNLFLRERATLWNNRIDACKYKEAHPEHEGTTTANMLTPMVSPTVKNVLPIAKNNFMKSKEKAICNTMPSIEPKEIREDESQSETNLFEDKRSVFSPKNQLDDDQDENARNIENIIINKNIACKETFRDHKKRMKRTPLMKHNFHSNEQGEKSRKHTSENMTLLKAYLGPAPEANCVLYLRQQKIGKQTEEY